MPDELMWTEIEFLVLKAGDRKAGVPPDTAALPYLARARGMAKSPSVGSTVEVETVVGRQMRGRVVSLNPGYEHTFGRPLPEWIRMRDSIRRELDVQRSVHNDGPGEV